MSIFDMYYTKIIKSHLKVQLSDGFNEMYVTYVIRGIQAEYLRQLPSR